MSNSAIKQIDKMNVGERADVFAVIINIEEKTATNNSPYVEFKLRDSTGEHRAKLWNKKLESLPGIECGKVIKARGQKDDHQQLIIEQIRLTTDTDDFDKELFVELLKPGFQIAPQLPIKKIGNLVLDEKVGVFALVKLLNEKETKTTKPRPYLNLEFQDCTGNIDGKWWDKKNSEVVEIGIQQGVLAYVTGSMSEWSDPKTPEIKNRQFTVTNMRLVTPEDGVKDDDFINIAPILGTVMYQQIIDFVNTFENEELKLLIKTIYEKYKEEITVFPASQLIHHDTKAGILYHKYQMLRCGLAFSHIYFDEPENILYALKDKESLKDATPAEETLNNQDTSENSEVKEEQKDLIFSTELLSTGILLHDIGKILELESNNWAIVKDYTKKGKLLGHMILGNDIVTEVAKELAISEEITILVKHMIVSHHFEETWGAYIKPQIAEAEMLHHLDLMDTKIYQFKKVLASVQKGFFSEKQVYLNSRTLYRSEF